VVDSRPVRVKALTHLVGVDVRRRRSIARRRGQTGNCSVLDDINVSSMTCDPALITLLVLKCPVERGRVGDGRVPRVLAVVGHCIATVEAVVVVRVLENVLRRGLNGGVAVVDVAVYGDVAAVDVGCCVGRVALLLGGGGGAGGGGAAVHFDAVLKWMGFHIEEEFIFVRTSHIPNQGQLE
jgi:hypothetical protein